MKKSILVFTLCLFPLLVFSQSERIDSLLEISSRAYENYDNEKSIEFAKQALEIAENFNTSREIVEAQYNIARSLCDLGREEESLQFIEKAKRSDFVNNDIFYSAKLKEVAASNYMMLNLDSQGISEFHNALSLLRNHTKSEPEQILTAKIYGNLYVIYHDAEMLDSAYYYLNKEIHLLKKLNETAVYQNLSLSYLDHGYKYLEDDLNFDSAEYYFEKSRDLLEKYKDPFKQDVFCAFADLNYKKKNYQSALNNYLKTQTIVESLNYSDPSFNYIYKRISKIYQKLGNDKLEEQYLQTFVNLEDSTSDSQIQKVGKVTTRLIKKHQRIADEKIRKTIWIITAVIVFILLKIIMFWHIFRRKSRRKETQLQQQIEELRKKDDENQELKLKINESFDELLTLAKENDSSFLRRFSEVYPDFIQNLREIHPKIQSGELNFCALLFLNFSTKDIAQYTFVTTKAVQNRKNRIRKKLNISSDEDIYVWIKNLIQKN